MSELSDLNRILPLVQVNPWQRLVEDWPQIRVEHEDTGSPYRHGVTHWADGTPIRVVLHKALSQVQRRCALAHELEHLDRGRPCESLRASIERRVLRDTARYLLPDLGIVGAALTVYSLRQAAAELWVTFPVLVDRLNHLSAKEAEYLGRLGSEQVA